MNAQESQVLQDFLNQLVQVHGVTKDPDADAMISRALAQQPDAAYLLVQRAILLDQALNNAKIQIAQLQNELQAVRAPQSARGGRFLDDAASDWGNSATGRQATQGPAAPPYQSSYPPNYQAGNVPQTPLPTGSPITAQARPGFFGGGAGSGFLGNIAATAAGVAGGAFLFQGLESLLGHHGGSGFLGRDPLAGQPAENVTVNNFYEGDGPVRDNSNDDRPSNDNIDDISNIDIDNFTDNDSTTI